MNNPVNVLWENAHLLPVQGSALDLACGAGRNALFLATHGLETHAWDINGHSLKELSCSAERNGLEIHVKNRDCEARPPQPQSFDVLVVSHFLYRPVIPALQSCLKPGGIIFYETFTKLRPTEMSGPNNPSYLLSQGELLTAFDGLEVLFYREEQLVGDTGKGHRGKAQLIAFAGKIPG